MSKVTETKLQIACNQIPGYFEVTQMLQQYILINGLSEATFSSYSRKLVDLANEH